MRTAQQIALLRQQSGIDSGSPARVSRRVTSMRRRRKNDVRKLAQEIGAEPVADGVLCVEKRFPLSHRHGNVHLARAEAAARDDGVLTSSTQTTNSVRYLDTETTGLAGGSGTLVFQIGVGYWQPDALVVTQFLMTSPTAENALLEALEERFQAVDLVVTYNGKSFDVPLLDTRYRMQGRRQPAWGREHVDLLHCVRRAFGTAMGRCRLCDAEREILQFQRIDDLAGSQAPEAWRAFVTRGQTDNLVRVLDHNLLDVLSLAALFPVIVDAHKGRVTRANPIAIARYWLRRGQPEHALNVLSFNIPASEEVKLLRAETLRRLRRYEDAARELEPLVHASNAEATERLAIHLEHRARDHRAAESMTHRLIALQPKISRHRNRLRRLQNKRQMFE